jgi:hypothetical protein
VSERASAEGPAPATARLGWRAALVSYVSYVFGVVLATWPLARHPASVWPPHHDPPMFIWAMVSMARWVMAGPWTPFDGNAFYPHGKSLALSESLLLPSILGLPGFVWGNPVLTFSLLVLFLWPLNGLAMAWAAFEVTGSRRAAWLAGAVFCLSPYFTEYYLEFNMLPAAPVPIALVAWVRWLERQQTGWLVLALGVLTLQGLTSWYYTIAMGFALATLTTGYACLRWRGWHWRRDAALAAAGLVAVAAILLPLAWPYVVVKQELGLERDLSDAVRHHADLMTFVTPSGRTRFLGRTPWRVSGAETSPFVGFSVLALGALALARGWTEGRRSGAPARVARIAGVALVLALGTIMAIGMRGRGWRLAVGSFHHRVGVNLFLWLAVGLLVILLLARGWSAARAAAPRRLTPVDWAWLLTLLTAVAVVLVLGPIVHIAGREVGIGPYRDLYPVLLPLHAVRITVRFAILSVFALGLMAALGWQFLETRVRTPFRRWLWFAALVTVIALEYLTRPATFVQVDVPRPVDRVLRADPADVAVLEWPVFSPGIDSDAMFRSLYHGKRVVNGFSGFLLPWHRELSTLLTTPNLPVPSAEAEIALRQIYPLRYLLVRVDAMPAWRAKWLETRKRPPPTLRFHGSYDAVDLYDVIAEPDRGTHLERLVSGGFLRAHPDLEIEVSSLGPRLEPGPEPFVDVRLNDRALGRLRVAEAPTTLEARMDGEVRRAAPNVFTLDYRYSWPPATLGARHRIGTTGVLSPGDLRVWSTGGPWRRPGNLIRLNADDLSPDGRGYNLVALDRNGRTLAAAGFDTFRQDGASAALADWVRALPDGTIVAGAVRDEASRLLDADAVAALRSLGVAGDLRGRFRAAHAFVGVKGAAVGAAAEALGAEQAEVRVGDPPRAGFTLRRFALR